MFRTELNITPSTREINLKDAILTIGSCFSDSIGKQFIQNKFNALANPFGTVYNPISITKLLQLAINEQSPDESSYLKNENLYANYDFHSAFSSSNPEQLESKIQNVISNTHKHLKESRFIIITLGTAFVYDRIDTGETVANCHKVSAKKFTKRLLSQKEILSSFDKLSKSILELNKDINIILTVSPVRHIKDTLELNNVSKSVLRLACHTLCQQQDHVRYFPSYEILIDDLRDYRFYKSDMIHPSNEAEEYIWNKFRDTYFDDQTNKFIKEWSKLRLAVDHKPFNVTSSKHQQFLRDTIDKIKGLDQTLDFGVELDILQSQLVK